MIKPQKCLICNNLVETHQAIIAPWITERYMNRAPSEANQSFGNNLHTYYFVCTFCDFSFFDRYRDDLITSLYREYRGLEYFELRNKWEPWYTQRENLAFSDNSADLELRITRLRNFYNTNDVDLNGLCGFVDLGGDLGQFIPPELKTDKYVVDASVEGSRMDSNGVIFLSRLSEIKDKVDLVQCCMVLEHVNNPIIFLQEIHSILNSEGYLLIEVPLDSFKVSRFTSKRIYFSYLELLLKSKKVFQFVDFLTGVYRLLFRRIPIWGILKSSEHINYFNVRTLRNILELSNYRVIAFLCDKDIGAGKIKLGSMKFLARKVN